MSNQPPFLPYSCPQVSEDDISEVVAALRDPTISQGRRLHAFETAFAEYTGTAHAVAFSSGTAALHAMCFCAGVEAGDEVIVPALTFTGTANAVKYTGARPVFCDIEPETLCIDAERITEHVTGRTKAVLVVDFAGHPCDYEALSRICGQRDLLLLCDAAHAPGARYADRVIGSLGAMSAFSFNPVKNLTSAEGGMVTTDSDDACETLQQFRVHGLTRNPGALRQPSPAGWYYEQHFLGYNYKLSELHAALGRSQLQRLDEFNRTRRSLAGIYDEALAQLPLKLPVEKPPGLHVYHLYVVQLRPEAPISRNDLFERLRTEGIGVQLHYIPVPVLPYYAEMGYDPAAYPVAMDYYAGALSLPLHHGMTDADATRVVEVLKTHLG